MKKTVKRAASLCLALLLSLLILALPVSAKAEASLSGSSQLRAGDTLTVTLRFFADLAVSLQGSITFDTNQLEYKSSSVLASTSWVQTTIDDGNASSGLISYFCDPVSLKPVTSSTKMLSVTFKVKSSLKVGTTVTVKGGTIAYGTWDEAKAASGDGTVSVSAYSAKILAPKSGNADLSSLDVRQTSFTPDFSPDVTKYAAASVPFDVSSLTLDMKTADAGAKVEVSGNKLSVGMNTVKVTVTAENGTTKVYSITVEREQDPNYVASSDATLSSVRISEGRLSPAFSPDIRDYVVYLPAEAVDFTVSGTPNDKKAIGGENTTVVLEDGENLLTYFNRAEDGTEMAYVFHVIRMPAYDGHLPEIIPYAPETEPVETEPVETEPASTEPAETAGQTDTSAPTDTAAPNGTAQETEPAPKETEAPSRSLAERIDSFTLIAVGAASLLTLGLGIAIGVLIMKKRTYEYEER